jgi:hypothetical protein
MFQKTSKFAVLQANPSWNHAESIIEPESGPEFPVKVENRVPEQQSEEDEFSGGTDGNDIQEPKEEKWFEKYYIPTNKVITSRTASYISQEKNQIFQNLFKTFTTKKVAYLSLQERQQHKEAFNSSSSPLAFSATSMISLTYGEMVDIYPLQTLFLILSKKNLLPPPEEGIFYDLGSGSGRIVFAADLLCPFRELIGIEILESLSEVANQVKENYYRLVENINSNSGVENQSVDVPQDYSDLLPKSFSPKTKQKNLFFYHNTILNEQLVPFVATNSNEISNNSLNDNSSDNHCQKNNNTEENRHLNWLRGNVIFINSTCFDSELMETISGHCSFLSSGTIVITLTNMLLATEVSQCELLHEVRLEMSWGMADFFIYRKN